MIPLGQTVHYTKDGYIDFFVDGNAGESLTITLLATPQFPTYTVALAAPDNSLIDQNYSVAVSSPWTMPPLPTTGRYGLRFIGSQGPNDVTFKVGPPPLSPSNPVMS